jgi:hypothetical protein
MTTLTIENENLKKTNFSNLKDLFDYAIDNQLISEVWVVNKANLSSNSKKLFDNSKDISDLINI